MVEFNIEVDPNYKRTAKQREAARRSIITAEQRLARQIETAERTFGLFQQLEADQRMFGLIRELEMAEQLVIQEQLQMTRQTQTMRIEQAAMFDMVGIQCQAASFDPMISQMNTLTHETRFDHLTPLPHESWESLIELSKPKPSLPHLSYRFFEPPADLLALPDRQKYEEEIQRLREENQALKLELERQQKRRDDDKGHPGTYL